MSGGEIKEGFRSPIVKDQDLKDMDSLEMAGGGWWAAATGEVDYKYVLLGCLEICFYFIVHFCII